MTLSFNNAITESFWLPSKDHYIHGCFLLAKIISLNNILSSHSSLTIDSNYYRIWFMIFSEPKPIILSYPLIDRSSPFIILEIVIDKSRSSQVFMIDPSSVFVRALSRNYSEKVHSTRHVFIDRSSSWSRTWHHLLRIIDPYFTIFVDLIASSFIIIHPMSIHHQPSFHTCDYHLSFVWRHAWQPSEKVLIFFDHFTALHHSRFSVSTEFHRAYKDASSWLSPSATIRWSLRAIIIKPPWTDQYHRIPYSLEYLSLIIHP